MFRLQDIPLEQRTHLAVTKAGSKDPMRLNGSYTFALHQDRQW